MENVAEKPVAVIILNYNGAALMRKYLPSVIRHTPALARLIVADNGSDDDSLKLLHEQFPQVEVLPFAKNYGFAEGYNRALAAVDAPYTLLLNSDVRVEDDYVTPLFNFLKTHPVCAACQPKVLSDREPGKFEYAGASGGFLDRDGYPYCRGRIFDNVESDNGQYDDPMEVDWASGAALMVDTEAYRKAGGLDSTFFAHMEEIDLCWRLRLDGRNVWAVPSARVYHLGGGSLAMGNPRKTYLNFRNNLLMMHKNLPRRDRKTALLRRRLLDAAAWAKFMVTGNIKNANAVLRAHRDYRRMARTQKELNPMVNLLSSRPSILAARYLRGIKIFDKIKEN